jgi:lipopolysaccharide transport system ATP-binding protein
MNSDIAISVRNLGKSYVIQHRNDPTYKTLRESLLGAGIKFLSPNKEAQSSSETFWALQDVSLDVRRGEVLGVIGRNGAGKSTLLKILSRITEPSIGYAEIFGRVGSLLEVGTGFHPELTGRENIYLNGSLLGMRKRQIEKVFDQIVDFAEVSRFIDTPVKRYSSGMYVRLAFAVAAHIQPEVMIVDEVLAVGDLSFQEKCLGKMRDIGGSGRTILFVSHNMDAIQSLCTRAVVMDSGKIVFEGPAVQAKEYYMQEIVKKEYSLEHHSGRGGSGGAKIKSMKCLHGSGQVAKNIKADDGLQIEIAGEISEEYNKSNEIDVAIGLDTVSGIRIATFLSSWKGCTAEIKNNMFGVNFNISSIPLIPGQYVLSASLILKGETLDSIQGCAAFNVVPEMGMHFERSPEWGHVKLSYQVSNII